MQSPEVIRRVRSSFRSIDPLDPKLSEEQEQRLPPFKQLVHTIAVDMYLTGEDPKRHKREIFQQAHEADKSWMNR